MYIFCNAILIFYMLYAVLLFLFKWTSEPTETKHIIVGQKFILNSTYSKSIFTFYVVVFLFYLMKDQVQGSRLTLFVSRGRNVLETIGQKLYRPTQFTKTQQTQNIKLHTPYCVPCPLVRCIQLYLLPDCISTYSWLEGK